MLCAWCPRASFVSSVSVSCVFLSAARGQLEHEAQVRSHVVEVHVCSDECSSSAKCCCCLFVCRMCRIMRVRCVLGNGRSSLVTKMCFPKHKKLLLMCGLADQICFRVRVFCAA